MLAVLLLLVLLVLLGWLATRVVGKRMIAALDALMARVPLLRTIYGSVKQLLATFEDKPGEVQRVVLIDFPSAQMKSVRFVTRTLTDQDTGQKLAAVYVPTTPNPTSGYLEIVPIDKVTSTSWTVDEAMTFIVSGGAVAPHHMNYAHSAAPPPGRAAEGAPTGSEGRRAGEKPADDAGGQIHH